MAEETVDLPPTLFAPSVPPNGFNERGIQKPAGQRGKDSLRGERFSDEFVVAVVVKRASGEC